MKLFSSKLGLFLTGFLFSSLAFAEEAAAGASGSNGGLIALAASIAVGLGTFGAASAQGRTAASAVEGIARNPNSRGDVFTPFLLGLAFMEFQAIMGFLIAFLLLGKI